MYILQMMFKVAVLGLFNRNKYSVSVALLVWMLLIDSSLDWLTHRMLILTLIVSIFIHYMGFGWVYILASQALMVLFFLEGMCMYLVVLIELCIVPTVLIMLKRGYQPERSLAVMYMFVLRTICVRVRMLVLSLIYINFVCLVDLRVSNLVSLVILLPMLMKLPAAYLHVWLPKAHVEAPTGVRVLLAGVMLKLGSYGMLRVLTLQGCKLILFRASFVSMAYFAIITLCQIDMKVLVAYSRVRHIALLFRYILVDSKTVLRRRNILMVRHALASRSLFMLCGMLFSATGRRSYRLMSSLGMLTGRILILAVALCMNMSTPPFVRLLVEVTMMSRLMCVRPAGSVCMILYFLYTRMYCIQVLISVTYSEYANTRLSSMPNRSVLVYVSFMSILRIRVCLLF